MGESIRHAASWFAAFALSICWRTLPTQTRRGQNSLIRQSLSEETSTPCRILLKSGHSSPNSARNSSIPASIVLTDLDRFLEKAIAEAAYPTTRCWICAAISTASRGRPEPHGLSVVSQIAHRLEDYMDTCDAIGGPQLSGIQTHLDRIRDILETGHDPEPDAAAEMLRRYRRPYRRSGCPKKSSTFFW